MLNILDNVYQVFDRDITGKWLDADAFLVILITEQMAILRDEDDGVVIAVELDKIEKVLDVWVGGEIWIIQ